MKLFGCLLQFGSKVFVAVELGEPRQFLFFLGQFLIGLDFFGEVGLVL